MIFLAIETSCDETAVSIVRADGAFPNATYTVLGNALFSQIDIHREYGGVFPSLAKREHAKTLVPMLERALDEANLLTSSHELSHEKAHEIMELLEREHSLSDALATFLDAHGKPHIDHIAVTSGPGLEPALWVGINFAKALSLAWNIPLIPINHMEGHIYASLFGGEKLRPVTFPLLALLISGGHTELVLARDWQQYELVGSTRDDAVGEAFDKVARMLELPYPGGPEISTLAETARQEGVVPQMEFPRPMLTADNCDFSFSGLKTAVLYTLKGKELTNELKKEAALAFEEAVTEVLVAKTRRALEQYDAKTLVIGGGVAANIHIRNTLTEVFENEYPERQLYLPEPKLTTDNAVMIALAAHARSTVQTSVPLADIVADGNKRLER